MTVLIIVYLGVCSQHGIPRRRKLAFLRIATSSLHLIVENNTACYKRQYFVLNKPCFVQSKSPLVISPLTQSARKLFLLIGKAKSYTNYQDTSRNIDFKKFDESNTKEINESPGSIQYGGGVPRTWITCWASFGWRGRTLIHKPCSLIETQPINLKKQGAPHTIFDRAAYGLANLFIGLNFISNEVIDEPIGVGHEDTDIIQGCFAKKTS